MLSCNHFVLSNSTMGWWAQYLCRNKGVVVSPKEWSKNGKKLMRGLIDSEWELIEI